MSAHPESGSSAWSRASCTLRCSACPAPLPVPAGSRQATRRCALCARLRAQRVRWACAWQHGMPGWEARLYHTAVGILLYLWPFDAQCPVQLALCAKQENFVRKCSRKYGALSSAHAAAPLAHSFCRYNYWPQSEACPECRGLPEEMSHTLQALRRGYAGDWPHPCAAPWQGMRCRGQNGLCVLGAMVYAAWPECSALGSAPRPPAMPLSRQARPGAPLPHVFSLRGQSSPSRPWTAKLGASPSGTTASTWQTLCRSGATSGGKHRRVGVQQGGCKHARPVQPPGCSRDQVQVRT